MKIDVSIDVPEIVEKLLDDKAKLFFSNTAYKLMNDYVPFYTGTLSQTVDQPPDGVSGTAEVKPGLIHYKAPYAQRVYELVGANFNKEKHPLATARWYHAMMESRKEKLVQTMQNYFEMGEKNG